MKTLAIIFGGVGVLCLLSSLQTNPPDKEDWGFFGHRRLNRLAVFTLPPEMIPFFKDNLEYLTEHAVDPDKRRYASKFEAVRHYIDLDHWGEPPFNDLPQNWVDALAQHAGFLLQYENGDSLLLLGEYMDSTETIVFRSQNFENRIVQSLSTPYRKFRSFFLDKMLPLYYEDQWDLPVDSIKVLFDHDAVLDGCIKSVGIDHFSPHGILPYHLIQMQSRLTKAFMEKNASNILRLCAEFGHYIGDAHVPLHTTENYNGQLTGQTGIHAFWESRLPELFADERYNYFTGKAAYIQSVVSHYWNIIFESHSLVDDVLRTEWKLRQQYPEDKQFCADERLGQVIRTQCADYAEAFHTALGNMVEQRMRATIHSIGSAWYTAWVDAGQPTLTDMINEQTTGNKIEEKSSKLNSFRDAIHNENY